MDFDFKIQKDNKKTIEITPNDVDDINLDELNGIDFNNNLDLSDDSSLNFIKEKINTNVPPVIKKQTPPKTNVTVKKTELHLPEVMKRPINKKPDIEPDSMDLGLDMIANQHKKIQVDEQSQVSLSSKSSRVSKKSLDLDFDNVKNIMDEKSENSKGSKDSKYSKNNNDVEQDNFSVSSQLSDRIKEKVKSKTYVNESDRKQELLFLFDKLEKKGVKLPQKFSMKTPIDELEKIYERLKNERDVQNSIKFQRKVLMGVVSTMEFLNSSMNPFDIDLDGWSESVMENYSEYDDIFEELYEKYKNKGHISPEVKLLMTLAGSAFYFHLSKMIIKPAEKKMQEMFGQMEQSGGGGGGGGDSGARNMGFMSGLMNNFMGGGGEKSRPSNGNNGGGMKGPQGFDDIISRASSDIPSMKSNISNGKKVKRTLNM
jgi:hypothetical protein